MSITPRRSGAPPGPNLKQQVSVDSYGPKSIRALQASSPDHVARREARGFVAAMDRPSYRVRGSRCDSGNRTPHRPFAGDLHTACPAVSCGNFLSNQSGVDGRQLNTAGRCSPRQENSHGIRSNTPQDKR